MEQLSLARSLACTGNDMPLSHKNANEIFILLSFLSLLPYLYSMTILMQTFQYLDLGFLSCLCSLTTACHHAIFVTAVSPSPTAESKRIE
jgi:hypothetical protein